LASRRTPTLMPSSLAAAMAMATATPTRSHAWSRCCQRASSGMWCTRGSSSRDILCACSLPLAHACIFQTGACFLKVGLPAEGKVKGEI
jgi:hypothetical protein